MTRFEGEITVRPIPRGRVQLGFFFRLFYDVHVALLDVLNNLFGVIRVACEVLAWRELIYRTPLHLVLRKRQHE